MSFTTLSFPPIMQVLKSTTQMEAAQPSPPPSFKLNTPPCETVFHLTSSNAVVIFSMSSCCMSTVAKQFLISLGVAPTVVELDEQADGPAIRGFLHHLAAGIGTDQSVPAVFIGGKFVGGVQTLMTNHLNGTLVPLLKEVGALWL